MPGVRFDETAIAIRVAAEFKDGMVVNLGVGIPTLASSYVREGREIIFHSENGVLGFGPIVQDPSQADIYLVNAGVQPVTRQPGMAFVSHEESFAIVRGGRVDITVLGGLQVSARGDLANHQLPGKAIGSFGGGQDLAYRAKRVIVAMTHQGPNGEPKLLDTLTLPLTAPRAVSRIVTDVAVIDVTGDGLVLRELAPGWVPEEIQAMSGARIGIGSGWTEMSLE